MASASFPASRENMHLPVQTKGEVCSIRSDRIVHSSELRNSGLRDTRNRSRLAGKNMLARLSRQERCICDGRRLLVFWGYLLPSLV